MTESNFIALHAQVGSNPLNIPGRLHLNVNQLNSNSVIGIIKSAIVHVQAHSIDGNTSEEIASIESVLEQVEVINFNYAGIPFTLNLNTTTYYPASSPFYYFTFDQITINDISDGNVVGADTPAIITDVTFTPFLADIDFGFSDYNPLLSNASKQRESTRLMQSDRLESTVLPANSASLYEETADKAFVQDSLYYDSGWSSARYKGTKTTPLDNSGIDPALSGRSFIGESFSSDTTNDYICQSDNRLQQEFFHDGRTQLPIFSISEGEPDVDEDGNIIPIPIGTANYSNQAVFVGGLASQQTETSAAGATTLLFLTNGDVIIDTGDLITLDPFSIFGAEFMRVVEVSSNQAEIIVERDIYRTRIPFGISYTDFPNGSKVYRIQKQNIYNIDNTGQSKLNSVGQSRIYVEGNNSIIEVNKAGVLTSSSFCPVFINYVDSPNG